MATKPTLYIVDGSSYIFRAYYAIRQLSNSKGLPTNAVYGFTQMLLRLLKEEKPEYLVMVFDSKEPSFRKKEYDAYKANREVPPDDLIPQFDYIRKVVDALNIPRLEMPGFEADDIIATIAKRLVPEASPVVIVTGDKDLMQLVNDHVQLLDEMKGKRIDIAGVKEKFGVAPEQVVEVLGLMGDSSDNIPGVPGVGPKTASQWIQVYGSIEGLYENLSEVKGKKAEDLKTYREQAFLSKRLATLHENVPMKFAYEDFLRQEPKADLCRELFSELEFHALLKEFGGESKRLSSEGYRLVHTEGEFGDFLKRLASASGFAFDTETTSLDALKAKLVGLSFGLGGGEAYYLAVGHANAERQLDLEKTLSALKPLLEDEKIAKYAQNFKYDAHVLQNYGIRVAGLVCDTMLASYLLDPAASHKLDNLASRHLEHKMISFEEVAGKNGDFAQVALETASAYSCEDADVTWQLAELFQGKLREEGFWKLFHEVEIPLAMVLGAMERRGIKVDRPFLLGLQEEFGTRIQSQEAKIHELAGEAFNIQSPKQLGTILFEKLKLPVQRKTKTGFSTDVDVLTELAKLHDLPREILEYRSLTKLKSTYVDALLAILDPETHRVHTSFNQTIAETGRLSSSDPNLQNIPIRSEDGAKIRKAFIADAGFVLMSADYSQIELRVLAELSGDSTLRRAFEEDLDIHRMTAASIFQVHEGLVTPQMRGAGKTVNFAVVYGQTPFGLSGQLGVTQAQAKKYIDQYFEKYAGVRDYREKILGEAREKKEVRTLLGRRRFVPDIDGKNTMARQLAERIAFNTVIQGTAADIIKKAMVEIHREMSERRMASHLLLQVHDELVFEVELSEREAMQELIRRRMEGAVPFQVALKVEIGTGHSWGEAH
ncbi:MAG: DNA polymerase I [Deltaproteobacteria bacterium]|nr:DNA polymerase I [Deltaproteobacteria bacterium]